MRRLAIQLLLVGTMVRTAANAGRECAGVCPCHCADCHNAKEKEGGLDLTSLPVDPSQPENFALWVKVHDRVGKRRNAACRCRAAAGMRKAGFLPDLSRP